MQINYKQVVIWDATLIDVGFLGSEQSVPSALRGLACEAVKITTGAPAATVGQWIPGAIVVNAVDGTLYINRGTTAAPVWGIVDSQAGALDAGVAAKTSANIIRGYLKLDVRPTGGTTNSYAYQIRANSAATTGDFQGIDNETHLTANGNASIRSTQGVAVVDATFTNTGGTIIGTYGQARIDGTYNGASGFIAGVYGLIEASTAITAGHVAAGWFDTHQANAITGEYEILYLTNNGTLSLDRFIYAYGEAASFLTLEYGTLPAYITHGTAADGTPIKIKIDVHGTAYYLNAYPTNHP